MRLAFSVDLEPNPDGSLDGIPEAMTWFDDLVPVGTVFATHTIATELPDVINMLADDYDIGVHVHPREFDHEHDQFAELTTARQRELVTMTRNELADAAGIDTDEITVFRAGRHSAGEDTFELLADLGFELDATVNVRYTDYLPPSITRRQGTFRLESGLLELPTSYYRPSLFSRPGIDVFRRRTVTATASTLRADGWFCSGPDKVAGLLDAAPPEPLSMYMHSYDPIGNLDVRNSGRTFRNRLCDVLDRIDSFLTASDICSADHS